MLVFGIVAVSFLIWAMEAPEVEEGYATRAAAEANQLFTRGWLPDIIPDSARGLKMLNNLDINTSIGSFAFDPHEADKFLRDIGYKR